jgi:hypothetical protein
LLPAEADPEKEFCRLKQISNRWGSTVAPIVRTTDGQRMSYSLAAAAKVTGLNKRAIREAIKGGKLAATRDELGQWHVESAELHRVYPAAESRRAGSDAAQPPAAPQDTAIAQQGDAIIRRAEERLQQQFADVRRERAKRDQAEAPPEPPAARERRGK